MKRLITLLVLLLTSILLLYGTSTNVNANEIILSSGISTETVNITFNAKSDGESSPPGSVVENAEVVRSNTTKLADLLEDYYYHYIKTLPPGHAKLEVDLSISSINNEYLGTPAFRSVTDKYIVLEFYYMEFMHLSEGFIVFYFDSNRIDYHGMTGTSAVGIWKMKIPKIEYSNVDVLPETYPGEVGDVTFSYSNYDLTVNIKLDDKTYILRRIFKNSTDMRIFDTVEAYYMNIDDTPQIIISHGEEKYLKDILTFPDEYTPAFVPHSIWDLKTHKLSTQNTYKTNVYVKQNKKGVIISYVYIDEFIIDKVISSEIRWTSREKISWPTSLIKGKYTDWETKQEIFLSDGYLTYKNLTSSWQNYMPIWNIMRGIYQTTKTYEMKSIDKVNLNDPQKDYNITRNELNNVFTDKNKDFETIKNDSRYNVFAFALEGGKSFMGTQTEFFPGSQKDVDKDDPRHYQIIEMKYITNGRLYSTKGHHMEIDLSLQEKLQGIESKVSLKLIIFIVVVSFIALVMFKNKAFKSPKVFIITIGLIAVFGLLIYLAYQYFVIEKLVLSVVRLL